MRVTLTRRIYVVWAVWTIGFALLPSTPAQAGAIFGVSAAPGVFSLQGTDSTTHGTVTLPASPYAVSGEVSWIQYWESNLETHFRYRYSYLPFQSPSSPSVNNTTQHPSAYTFGVGKDLTSRLRFVVEGILSDYILLQTVNTSLLNLTTASWFSAGISGSFVLIQTGTSNDNASIRFKGLGHIIFPSQSNYAIGVNNVDFGGALAFHYDRRKWFAELGVYYTDQILTSTAMKQSLSGVGISLGVSYKIGSAAKIGSMGGSGGSSSPSGGYTGGFGFDR